MPGQPPVRRAPSALWALLIAAVTPLIHADNLLSGEQLQASCNATDPHAQALCQGYIMGAADAGELCIPASITPATLRNLVQTAVDANTTDPALAVQQRLRTAFPCDQSTQAGGQRGLAADAEQGSAPPHHSPNWSNKARIGK